PSEADAGRDDALLKPKLGLDAPESTGGEAGDLRRRQRGRGALHLDQPPRRGLGGGAGDAREDGEAGETQSTHIPILRGPGRVGGGGWGGMGHGGGPARQAMRTRRGATSRMGRLVSGDGTAMGSVTASRLAQRRSTETRRGRYLWAQTMAMRPSSSCQWSSIFSDFVSSAFMEGYTQRSSPLSHTNDYFLPASLRPVAFSRSLGSSRR